MKALIYDFKNKYVDKWKENQEYKIDCCKSYKLDLKTDIANQEILFTDDDMLEINIEGIEGSDKNNWNFKINNKNIFKNREISISLNCKSLIVKENKYNKIPLVKIKIPKKAMIDSIELSSESGNIHLENCSDFEKLYINTLSGDINIERLNGIFSDLVEIKSISGNVNIEDSLIHKHMINSSSGDIHFENLIVDDCSIETESGKIKLNNMQSLETTVNSLNGDVDIRTLESKKIKINTKSSNVIAQNLFSKYIKINSLSGSIYIDNSSKPDYNHSMLKINTTIGKCIVNQ